MRISVTIASIAAVCILTLHRQHSCLACGGSYHGSSGIITSPNYPDNYEDEMYCYYIITVEEGKVINLEFTHFHLESSLNGECRYDYLKIFDGIDTTGDPLDILCGDDIPALINSNGNTATLNFRSDSSGRYSGFSVTYTAVDPDIIEDECGPDYYSGDAGVVTSPNFPNNYGNNLNCLYHIVVEPGKIIYFQFTYFYLEQDCRYDSLKIFDGSTAHGNPLIERCWDRLPDDVDTTGNVATLQLRTDDYAVYPGFSVNYTAVLPNTMGCGGFFTDSNSGIITSPNFPSNYDNEQGCVYHIIMEEGKYINFHFTYFELQEEGAWYCVNDYLRVYEGDNIDGYLRRGLCGDSIPDDVTIRGNAAALRFHSDQFRTYSGFSVTYTAYVPATDDNGCGGTFTGPSGFITSPYYSEGIENPMHCEYHVTLDAGKVIEFVFESFALGSYSTCTSDSLTMYDGATDSAPSLGVFCGNEELERVYSTANTATLIFQTDGTSTGDGFVIHFTAIDESVLTAPNQEPNSP